MKIKRQRLYIMALEKDGIIAQWTLATNRTDCWKLATKGSIPKERWVEQGWKCIPVRLEAI